MEVLESTAVIEKLVKPRKKLQHTATKKESQKEELPLDFKAAYSQKSEGKKGLPFKADNKGFLFYPLKSIVSAGKIAGISVTKKNTDILIFGEYKNKTWWYGVQMLNDSNYMMGLITKKGKWKPITNSVTEFIELYRKDASKLYDGFELYHSYEDHMME